MNDATTPAVPTALKPDDWPETIHVGKAVIRFPSGVESGNWYSKPDKGEKTIPFARAAQSAMQPPSAPPAILDLYDHVAGCIRQGNATEQLARNVDLLKSEFLALLPKGDDK